MTGEKKVIKEIALILTLTLASCSSNTEELDPPGEKVRNEYRINSSLGAIADIRAGMTDSQLMQLGHPASRRFVNLEGDEYTIIDIQVGDDVTVECLFDSDLIYSLTTTSDLVRDEHSLGVGSTLAELRRIYPQGRTLVGDEDGRYANFVNGSKVVFELDQAEIALQCFGPNPKDCGLDPDIRVVKVVVNSGPTI